MKLPFTYKHHFFKSVLVGSLVGHLVVLGSGSYFFSNSAKYGVESGPSNMEVVLLKEPAPKKKIQNLTKVFSIQQDSKRMIEQKEEKEKKVIEESVFIPAERGSITETKPDYLKNPAPVYPELARKRGWEGTVLLEAHISEKGTVSKISVSKSSGSKILDDSALESIKKWKFSPARLGAVSFSSRIRIPVKFVLEEEK